MCSTSCFGRQAEYEFAYQFRLAKVIEAGETGAVLRLFGLGFADIGCE